MDAQTIQKITDLRDEGRIHDIGGMPFSSANLKPVFFSPRPERFIVRTLTGLSDYIKSELDKLDRSAFMLHVESPEAVHLVSNIRGTDMKRDAVISAEIDPEFKAFPFDHFMDVESFLIKLRYLFSPSPDLDKLLAYASTITSSTELRIADDGVTQLSTVKRGASGAVIGEAPAPVIVNLSPFRTFREIDQTISEFLFRITLERDGTPRCALFEADGGRWRNVTMLNIKEYLEDRDLGVSIIA